MVLVVFGRNMSLIVEKAKHEHYNNQAAVVNIM